MNANYFKVGVFVVVAVALLAVAIVILGAGTLGRKEILFETYFDQSVSGLAVGAPVQLQGVRLGQVKEIGFASEVYQIPHEQWRAIGAGRYVRVVCAVPANRLGAFLPEARQAREAGQVNPALRLRLTSNILTGQASLEGTYVDPNQYPVAALPWTPQYLYIPSAPSQFAALQDSLNKILAKLQALDVQGLFAHADELLTGTTQKVEAIDTEKIGQQLEDLLTATNQAVADANVPGLSRQVTDLFAEARVTNQHLQELLARPDREQNQANIAEAVNQLNMALQRANLLILTQTPRIEGTMENFKKISDNLRDLTANLKRDPASLLLKSPPPKSEY